MKIMQKNGNFACFWRVLSEKSNTLRGLYILIESGFSSVFSLFEAFCSLLVCFADVCGRTNQNRIVDKTSFSRRGKVAAADKRK